MNQPWTPSQLADLAAEFHRLGYLILEHALDADETARLNAAVDRHWLNFPDDWISLSDSFCEGTNILPHTSDFDEVIEHSKTLPLLCAILGKNITFEEFAIMLRNPTANLNEIKGWHRDLVREFDRRHEIDAVSIMYYLSDVSPTDHCFSVIPESHNRLIDLNPKDVPMDAGIDCIGPAGTAVIFHARAIHNARLKQNSTQRRTLQAYYSNRLDQRTNEWTQIPARLYEKNDQSLPLHFYSKWNVTNILDGVGKRPEDIDPALPLSAVIKEVQRRAKLRM
ncbi:MAG: phytanoyl-CoA dioxygenase family protein [Planctomycetota bacterium]|nr:phytanoyl-CoA dioxygenase family protein [Planctomycetota bacterium]